MRILLTFIVIVLTSCSSKYPNNDITNQLFPAVSGTSLTDKKFNIPFDFKGKETLLILGYKQDSQFDIDRWLIGLDMTQTQIDVYELPTIQGMFPRMFSTQIDNGMRKGIPKELWKGVITIYKDGDKLQRFTGNHSPNNARVVLLDAKGTIQYFYDRGFSVDALKNLKQKILETRKE